MNNNLDKGSFILQLYSLLVILKDFNNGDLMNELQTQDEMYLKKIIKQNEEIKKGIQEILKNMSK